MSIRPVPRPHLVLIAILIVSSFALKLLNLGHAAIHAPDEVITAVVSQNLLKHPLVPTLVDPAYLPHDDGDWQSSHLWMFKPPMAFWQIAAGFAVFGVNTFMLRLPSAILSSLAALLTYLIGRRWMSSGAGLIAAGLQAFSPAIFMLVQGYQFSDHIDVALLFWTEMAVYFLVRAIQDGNRRIDLVLCGVAQGLAFLSKWHLAAFVAGLAITAWWLPRTRLVEKDEPRLSGRGLLLILACAVLTVAPWLAYIEHAFPGQLPRTNQFVLRHLREDMSNCAAPWDRLLFDYNIKIFYLHYPAVLAALVWGTVQAFQTRRLGLWLALAWALGVYLPNVAAHTKTPSSTLIGWPACWLLLGHMIWSGIRGDRWALGTWLITTLLGLFLVRNADIPGQTWGYGPYPGAIMVEHIWVAWHLVAALAVGALIARFASARVERPMIVIATAASIVLAVRWWGDPKNSAAAPRGYLTTVWKATRMKADEPDFSKIGAFARMLPANAAFAVDEQVRSEARLIQFAGDRTCYPTPIDKWRDTAGALAAAGALPYLVTPTLQPLPVVFVDPVLGRNVYACTPKAKSAADRALAANGAGSPSGANAPRGIVAPTGP